MNGYIPPTPAAPRLPHYRLTLTVGDHSPRHLRRIARSLLAEWELAHLTDTVELALTELVTNVHRHVPDRRCTVLLLRQPAGLRVEATDDAPPLPPVVLTADPEAESGRGLLLLESLVDKWGVAPQPGGGKTVWCEWGHPN
ncbi:ATP-binding protein [Streptomyces longwoodensis]|uniref:ATP-binding protein n=1 Tax=Streptomyces longwoodensis TaxID=68231 RepID=UPI002E813A04|nr:ATP-binding protein [Streptomyces longwoodensis]WTI47363.1 ATP-binding protein [Streptomyces longwoodensis]WUC60112.1 ATP-binding protein [Streptomyces longwoodensis]WUC73639.1 ATP-binding protein [Streptomyces longwoodensis]